MTKPEDNGLVGDAGGQQLEDATLSPGGGMSLGESVAWCLGFGLAGLIILYGTK